jgi:hypothetical protein
VRGPDLAIPQKKSMMATGSRHFRDRAIFSAAIQVSNIISSIFAEKYSKRIWRMHSIGADLSAKADFGFSKSGP